MSSSSRKPRLFEVVVTPKDQPIPNFSFGIVVQRQVRNAIRRRSAVQQHAKRRDNTNDPLVVPQLGPSASSSKLPRSKPRLFRHDDDDDDKAAPHYEATPSLHARNKAKRLFRGSSPADSEPELTPPTRASLVKNPKAFAKRTAQLEHRESDSDSGIDESDSSSPSPPRKKATQSHVRQQPRAGPSKNDKSRKPDVKISVAPPPKRPVKHKKRKRHISPSSDDLEVELNEKAYVKSTGGGQKAAITKRLAMLKRARQRKQGIEPSDETEDSSDESTSGSGSDDDSSASSSFLNDEPEQRPNPYSPRKSQPGSRALPDGAQNILKDMGFVRASLEDNIKDYVKWAIILLLDMEIPKERAPQLERARTTLQNLVKSAASVLRTGTMRREFYWHLSHYPHFERVHAADEGRKGCMACKKTNHICESRFTFFGRFYDPQTLTRLTREENDALSSDCSNDLSETFAIKSEENDPAKRKRTFYLGSFCASRARFLHMAAHWEMQAVRRIKKGKAFTAFDEEIQRLKRDPREDEIEKVVAACAPALGRRLKHMKDEAEKIHHKKGKYGSSNKSNLAHDYSTWTDDQPIE